ncbi:MAG: hypothetical protein LBR07_07615, partial [Puniceicoccales bacterium]|nr:hypothetical protein [Puniceicoccales bacterium]
TGWYGERIKTVILENIENRGAGWQEQLATLERALVITTVAGELQSDGSRRDVTYITTVIVPEPSTYAAGATALLTGLLLLRNRRRRRSPEDIRGAPAAASSPDATCRGR